jgi:hypothetical protein
MKMYLMKLRNEGHERMPLGFGIDLKMMHDDDSSPVSKVKYVNHYPPLRFIFIKCTSTLTPRPVSHMFCE